MIHLPTGDVTNAHSRDSVPKQAVNPSQREKPSGESDRHSFATVFTDLRVRASAEAEGDANAPVVPARRAENENEVPTDADANDDVTAHHEETPGRPVDVVRDDATAAKRAHESVPLEDDRYNLDSRAASAARDPDDLFIVETGPRMASEGQYVSRASGHEADNRWASAEPHTPTPKGSGTATSVEETSASMTAAGTDQEVRPAPAIGMDRSPTATAAASDNDQSQPPKPETRLKTAVATVSSRADVSDHNTIAAGVEQRATAPNPAASTYRTQAAGVAKEVISPSEAPTPRAANPSGYAASANAGILDTTSIPAPATSVRQAEPGTGFAIPANSDNPRSTDPQSQSSRPQPVPEPALTPAKLSAPSAAQKMDAIASAPNAPSDRAKDHNTLRSSDNSLPPPPSSPALTAPMPSPISASLSAAANPTVAGRSSVISTDVGAGDTGDEIGRITASTALTSQVETSAPLRQSTMEAMRSPDLPRHVAEQLATGFRGGGEKSAEIHLNPAELGRVRINLHTGDAGVVVHVVADRPETLDLLRRHADMLAQEFRDIGYGAAEFSFGQSDNPRSGQNRRPDDAIAASSEAALSDGVSPPTASASSARGTIMLDRVDIRL